jgi:hypothetical protein
MGFFQSDNESISDIIKEELFREHRNHALLPHMDHRLPDEPGGL